MPFCGREPVEWGECQSSDLRWICEDPAPVGSRKVKLRNESGALRGACARTKATPPPHVPIWKRKWSALFLGRQCISPPPSSTISTRCHFPSVILHPLPKNLTAIFLPAPPMTPNAPSTPGSPPRQRNSLARNFITTTTHCCCIPLK